jgi:hypothetical protein
MFIDSTLDTSVTGNRRIFITDKGKPASMGLAADFFGKEPEVKLHGSTNWKKGRNTGSLANDPPDPGVFVGDIKTYRPNPNLNGKQGS